MDDFINIAEAMAQSHWSDHEEVERCQQLADDLGQAFSHTDSVQRLRTNLIYLVMVYDCVYSHTGIDKLLATRDALLCAYMKIVFIDDYEHQFEYGVRPLSR